ncbi:uncharacterized protein LOC143024763 [Oratosquilla oratoria]|uniref:uncharacterized protein LOC143024763 n=1 Tax=Oratosquilla oratoria TaxID=337810 RepID=UPI003F767130
MFVFTAATVLSLTTAVNLTANREDCPYLYNRLPPDGPCITAYGMHKAPWADSRFFCKSIFGELLVIKNVTVFTNLVQYLNKTGIQGDFWIGGYKNQGDWIWVDNTPMAMGTPFWSLKPQNTNRGCTLFQAPYLASDIDDNCASIAHSTYYYISNEKCTEERSPLCVYKGAKELDFVDTDED